MPAVVHFHSAYSYGRSNSSPQHPERRGKKAGLHFAIVADHFRLDARVDGLEGYHPSSHPSPSQRGEGVTEGTFPSLIVGEEISPR